MEFLMHLRNLAIISLTFLLFLPEPAEAATEVHLMNDGTQVQIHFNEKVLDRNHDQDQYKLHELISRTEQADSSKTEAGGMSFQVPLRRGLSNKNPGVFTIAAFVDHDDLFPDSLLDWNCGERTYDADTFNHNGTDYNGVQFPWLTMANDGMVVIAAEDGEIIEIHDGEPDNSCSFDPNSDANRVILLHGDGSTTIYAHMKTGSVTPRKVGDRIEQGDYLGVMGSSGLSTGPHLHLGVQDLSNNLFDPYAGNCNALNDDSFWAEQELYFNKEVLALATHSAAPEYPPCPQQEVPHFKDVFETDDDIFASVTVRDFDGTDGDEIGLEVRGPSNEVIFSSTFSSDSIDFLPSITLTASVNLGDSPTLGKYSFRAMFGGQTEEHYFYVGAGPDPAPATKPANNAFTGLWFDPALDGEGFNIVTAEGGTIVYFYGSDNRGNRVWLISDPIPGEIKTGIPMEALMFESTGGIFTSPVRSSRGLSAWGTLTLLFSACESGQSSLNGADGAKVSQITKLAGVSGASCVDGDVPADSGWAGLWFDPAKDGEGYNLIVAPAGRILYFYGFRSNGLRLWLISAVITETLDIGKTVEVAMFEATQGTFSTPVPSGESLIAWGTAKITVVDCNTVTIVVDGNDGVKTSNTVRLAGITGLSCTD
jgi:murein DD-endopeptidase MepM/ murein hydrolase activator NlpD